MILKKLSLAILLTIYVVTAWSEKRAMDMRKTHKRGGEHFPKTNVGYREEANEKMQDLSSKKSGAYRAYSNWGDISIQDYDKPDRNQLIMPSGEI